MKQYSLLIVVFATKSLFCQPAQQVIKQHYHKMDSLWQIDKYTELINYAKTVEPYFKQNNKYPYYDYYKLVVIYLGDAYIENGDYDEAEELLLNSSELIESQLTQLHPLYADCQYELGRLHMLSGRFTKAYTYYIEAWKGMERWRSLRWWKFIKVGNELINICASIGRYQDGEYYANKIEESIPKAKYTKDELLEYYSTRALLYLQMMSIYKAELYMNKVNELVPAVKPNIFAQVELKNMTALIYMASNRNDSAEQILSALMTDLKNKKMRNTDANYYTIGNLVSILLVNGQHKKADSLLANVLPVATNSNSKFIAALYLNQAVINLKDTAYAKALVNIETGLTMIAAHAQDELQFTLPARIVKSIILQKMNQTSASYELYTTVMNEYLTYIRKNIAYASESEKNNLLTSYYNMANFAPTYVTNDRDPDNLSRIKRAWEQQLFFKGLTGGEQTKFYKALRQNVDTAVQALYTEWRELKQYIHAENQKPPVLRNKNLPSLALMAEQKEKSLTFYLPDEKDEKPINVRQLYQHLKKGEALVDFSHHMRFSSALVDSLWYGAYILRYDDPEPIFINICSEEKLNKIFQTDRSGPDQRNLLGRLYPLDAANKKHDLAGDHLYNLIWRPIRSSLTGIKTVYIVADGLLYKVAFHALPLEQGGFLSDKIDIRYLYHANKLCDSNFRDNKKPQGIACWGGIRFDTTNITYTTKKTLSAAQRVDATYFDSMEVDLPYLPGTLQEAKTIKGLCQSAHISFKLYSGANASELSFKQNFSNPVDVVHIATHGRFKPNVTFQKPEFQLSSTLIFTPVKDPMSQVELFMAGCNNFTNDTEIPTGGNDARLKADEIAKLDGTGKQLVTLIACESGSGDIISAEGVFGLVRAFKMAGVDKVIISLWEVDDGKTNEMISVFYTSLLKGIPANEALRAAQRYMQAKKYPPYNWAGFVLIE